ncbi:hypothetical protein OLA23_10520, partial [Streptococcus pneumoniae]|nr:hypothetical protein [Streptococcus pneumoniae]
MKEPKSILAIGVIVGETEEEAKYLAGPAELSWARMSTGSSNLSLPTLEEAKTHVYTPEEKAARNANKDRFVIGSVNEVAHQLRQIAKAALVDEIMIAD